MAINYKRRLQNLENRDWNNKSKKSNIDYIKKQLKDFGIDIPKYIQQGKLTTKNINALINKFTRKANNIIEQKRRDISIDTDITKDIQKELNKLSKFGKEVGSNKRFNETMRGKFNRDFHNVANANFLLYDFFGHNNYGKIKATDYIKLMGTDFTKQELLGQLQEKTKFLDLNNYKELLQYYGLSNKEIKELAKTYNNMDYVGKDYLLGVLNKYGKGRVKYELSNSYDESRIYNAKTRLKEIFVMAENGYTENGERI